MVCLSCSCSCRLVVVLVGDGATLGSAAVVSAPLKVAMGVPLEFTNCSMSSRLKIIMEKGCDDHPWWWRVPMFTLRWGTESAPL
jgi:hypothetical protein